jgi:vitamin B12 transporter
MSLRFLACRTARGTTLFLPFSSLLPSRLAALAATFAALGVTLAPATQAQTGPRDDGIQRVVVTATRSPVPVRQLAAEVTVITAETLAQTPGEPLVDVISRLGGVQITRTGGPGQTSGTFIRGVAQKQSIVVVDGVRMVDVTSGQVSLETLSADHIERIEILKGPASSIWGADAVGGVIHIITREPKSPLEAQVRLAMGGYGSSEQAASLGGRAPEGPLTWQLGMARESSRGVSVQTPLGLDFNPDRDGYRMGSAHLSMGLRFSQTQRVTFRATGSSLNSRYDGTEDYVYDPITFDLLSSDSSKDLRTRKTNGQWSMTWTSQWRTDFSSELRVGRSALVSRSGIAETYDVRSTRDQALVQTNWSVRPDVTASGFLEGASEEGRLDGFYGDYAQRRRNQAIGLAVQGGRTGDLSWQIDARREVSSVFAGNTTGRAGLRWSMSDDLAFLGVWGTTFRAPTFDDLYYPNYSNPSLKSERGRSQELGLIWSATTDLELSSRIWRNRVTDLIEADQSTFIPYNVSEAKLEGVSLRARSSFLGAKWDVQTDWTQAVNATTGQRLARRAPQQHVVSASLPVQRMTVSADLKFLGRRRDSGQVLPSETTLNLGASWRKDREWTLQARLLNATDEAVQPAYGYQGLGRQFWVGVQYAPVLP